MDTLTIRTEKPPSIHPHRLWEKWNKQYSDFSFQCLPSLKIRKNCVNAWLEAAARHCRSFRSHVSLPAILCEHAFSPPHFMLHTCQCVLVECVCGHFPPLRHLLHSLEEKWDYIILSFHQQQTTWAGGGSSSPLSTVNILSAHTSLPMPELCFTLSLYSLHSS